MIIVVDVRAERCGSFVDLSLSGMTLRGRQSSGDFEMVGTASETCHSLSPSTLAQADCLDNFATLSSNIATMIVLTNAMMCHVCVTLARKSYTTIYEPVCARIRCGRFHRHRLFLSRNPTSACLNDDIMRPFDRESRDCRHRSEALSIQTFAHDIKQDWAKNHLVLDFDQRLDGTLCKSSYTSSRLL